MMCEHEPCVRNVMLNSIVYAVFGVLLVTSIAVICRCTQLRRNAILSAAATANDGNLDNIPNDDGDVELAITTNEQRRLIIMKAMSSREIDSPTLRLKKVKKSTKQVSDGNNKKGLEVVSQSKKNSDKSVKKLLSTECSICLGEYKMGQHVAWSRNYLCDHVFHRDCIIEWLVAGNESCPCCRNQFLALPKHDKDDHP
mmetsp:Transcript_31394/g.38367  ORF Transcript_31394/g.38367 Transcript_31394/m.38367 type:complete len:198 (+) Transcript_31394:99-692(+)